jgi:hypothetical protein
MTLSILGLIVKLSMLGLIVTLRISLNSDVTLGIMGLL